MKSHLFFLATIGTALLLAQATARAQTAILWKGTISTDWNNAGNWSPAQVPTAIDHVTISSGNVLVPASGVFSTLNWSGGDISGFLNVASGAVLTIGGTVYLDAALTNSGTINWTNGDINLANQVTTGGPLVNLAGAIWNISCDRDFDAENSAGYPTYPNAYAVNGGLIHKTGGTGTTSFGGSLYGAPLRNTGTVQVDAGTIEFFNSATLAGTFAVTTAGSLIEFAHGNYATTNITISGAGTVEFAGDSLTLSNNIIPNLKLLGGKLILGPSFQGGTITNLTITNVTLQGSSVVSGTLNWNSGYVSGALNVASGAVLNIGGTVNLDGALTNSGTVNWTNGDINIANVIATGGPFVNLAGATFNIACDHTLGADNQAGYPTYPNCYVVNAGLVRKITTTGSTAFGGSQYGAPFQNTGTVEADAGTIQFFNSAVLAGTYTATTAGAVVQFIHGNYTATNFTVSGVGTVEFTGDTLTLSNNVIANLKLAGGKLLLGPSFQGGSITNLTIAGTTLAGTNTVTGVLNCNSGGTSGSLAVGAGGLMNWLAGDITGTLIVSNNGVLSINGQVYLDGALTNAGTINWTNGNVYMAHTVSSAGPAVNLAGGTWNIQCDEVFSTDNPSGYPADANAYILNQGLFRKTANTGVTEIGYRGAYNVLFKNSGKVEADAGTLSFEGGYQDDGTGKLVLSPAGLNGTNFGLISFYTKPVFNGSLNLSLVTRNGFQFSAGQSFRLMSFPAATNWVSCLNGLDLENGILFQPQFTVTNLSLLAKAYDVSATRPQLFLGRTFGGVSVLWPDKFSAWTLQSATNLTAAPWTTVSACSDNALVPNGGQKQFFRMLQ